ncbi:MAG: hypothetical protein WC626_08400 [Methanoregula sp.]
MIKLVGPFFRRLCMLSVIFPGSALPTIENARYSNGEKLTNHIWNFIVADGWMKATSNLIKDFLLREYLIVNSPVTLKKRKIDLLLMAPLDSGNSYIPINRIQNGECKRTVIRNLGR